MRVYRRNTDQYLDDIEKRDPEGAIYVRTFDNWNRCGRFFQEYIEEEHRKSHRIRLTCSI